MFNLGSRHEQKKQVWITLFATLLCCAPGTARTDWEDRLNLILAEEIVFDDNVFRLPQNVDAGPLPADPATDDRYFMTTAGLQLYLPISAQRLTFDGSLNRYRFDRFKELNLDGYSGVFDWKWQLGDSTRGNIGASGSRSLSSFSNVPSGEQSGAKNFRSVKHYYFDAQQNFSPRWLIRAGIEREEHKNSAQAFLSSDIRVTSSEFALAFVAPADSRIELSYQDSDGDMPVPQILSGSPVDNSYRQRSLLATLDWSLSRFSQLRMSIGRRNRSHAQLSLRDFDGSVAKLEFDWQPFDRVTLYSSARRDVSSIDEVYLGYALVDSVALSSLYRATEKVDLLLNVRSSKLEYAGDPEQIAAAEPHRSERQSQFRLALRYRPRRQLMLELALEDESRSSSLEFARYEARIVSFGIRYVFGNAGQNPA